MAEHLICNEDVIGSSPIEGSIFQTEVQVSRLHPLEYCIRCLTAVNNRAHDPASLSEHFLCRYRLTVRTPDFHSDNRGSIPRSGTNFMNDYHLQPPQSDIDAALKIEKSVKQNERERYLEYMNNVPMSDRKTARELRDGCILSQLFNRFRS